MRKQWACQAWHKLRAGWQSEVFRDRIAGHFMFWSITWPLFIIAAAVFEANQTPMPVQTPLHVMIGLALGGTLLLLPELLGCMLLASVATITFFSILGSRKAHRTQCFCEAMFSFFTLSLGIALEYPSTLNSIYFAIVRPLTCEAALACLLLITVLAGILLGLRQQSRFGALRGALSATILLIVGWGTAQLPVYTQTHPPVSHNVVLLGIDSLSQTDNPAVIRDFTEKHHGIYYTNAVTSGLMTNAVWTSIVMHRPVHTTGVLLTFQSPDWNRSNFNLAKAAENAGYETWSFITDQSTTYVGSDAGFEKDHSSMRGWMQVATATVKNASVLIPLVTSRLPRFPFARSRRNQAGTYCYDLQAQLHQVFTTGNLHKPVFIASHIEYLHQNIYPAMRDLSSDERSRVLSAPVDSLQDWSYHWFSPEPEDEPLHIGQWKIQHLQQVLTEELDHSGYLQPQHQNRLVIFSDHGLRQGISESSFGAPRYYNVLLASFGAPAIARSNDPVSVLDIPEMLGFPDPSMPRRAEPVVEYSNFQAEEYSAVATKAKVKLDGRIDLPLQSTTGPQQRLEAFRPYSEHAAYKQVGTDEPMPMDRTATTTPSGAY